MSSPTPSTIDLPALLIAISAGFALVLGSEVMTFPHLILGLILLPFANQLDFSKLVNRGARSAVVLLIFATICDGILIASDIYDLEGAANPFRPRWIFYFVIWVIFNGMQSGLGDSRSGDESQA